MILNREELLAKLEAVRPGLSAKALLQQSDHFIFVNDRVLTFNGEVACSQKCKVGFEGAVPADKLLELLSLRKDEEIEVESNGKEMKLKGSPWKCQIVMESEIHLPIESIEAPEGWTPLHEFFSDAVKLVHQCASNDQTQFNITCVHIHPKWVQAYDTYQAARYKFKTGFQEEFLVRKSSIRNIVDLGMTKFSETPAWLHFRNATGLTFSCLRFTENYPDIDYMFDTTGNPTALPKGLTDAVESASIFTKDKEDDSIIVELTENKIRIKGVGEAGKFNEPKSCRYDGREISFTIPPKLLLEITSQHKECLIGKKRLKVDGGDFTYITTLGKVEEDEK